MLDKNLSTLTYAYLGDAVFELRARGYLCAKHDYKPNVLHGKVVKIVCAAAQARLYDEIFESLSADEQSVIKRGRNATGAKVPKNSNVADYRKATGVETLFGYLYSKGEIDRLDEIFRKAIEIYESSDE